MTKSVAAYALDAIGLIDKIRSYTGGFDAASFERQELVPLAAERMFIGLGEALSGIRRIDPETAALITDLGRAITLRNILAHNYEGILADRLWDAVTALPALPEALNSVLTSPNGSKT